MSAKASFSLKSVLLSDDPSEVDWKELAVVFERAPLGKRLPATLRRTFRNSPVRCFAWHRGRLVGAGRVLTDFYRAALVLDVVVLPEYQGRGLGRKIMRFLTKRAKASNLILYAAPGREGFYRKLGYRKMTTAMALFPDPEERRRAGYLE